jgi:hypothetical protein
MRYFFLQQPWDHSSSAKFLYIDKDFGGRINIYPGSVYGAISVGFKRTDNPFAVDRSDLGFNTNLKQNLVAIVQKQIQIFYIHFTLDNK